MVFRSAKVYTSKFNRAYETAVVAGLKDIEKTADITEGGLVIVVRHGATFADQADTDPRTPDNVAAQRQLNDKGKALAKTFGEALRQIGVPVGKVYTSRFNRAYETAVIAGFKYIEKTADISEGGLVVSPNENNRRTEAFRKMLGTAPQPGTTTILVTHKPNVIDALGKDWFDVKEGEASLFPPRTAATSLSRASRWTNGPASRPQPGRTSGSVLV